MEEKPIYWSSKSVASIKFEGREIMITKDLHDGSYFFIERFPTREMAVEAFRKMMAEREKAGEITSEMSEEEIFGKSSGNN